VAVRAWTQSQTYRRGRELAVRIADDRISSYSAEIAFHLILAFLPLLILAAAVVAAIDTIFSLDVTSALLEVLENDAPAGARELLGPEVRGAFEGQQAGLISVGLLGTLWSASSAAAALIAGLDQVYQVQERRTPLKRRATSFALIGSLSLLVIAGFTLVVFGAWLGDVIAERANLGDFWDFLWPVTRTLAAAVFLLVALALVYWLGPNTEDHFRLFTPGSIFGTVAWLVVTAGFAFYVANFGNYNAIYGSIGAAIVLLVWFYVTAFIFLLGGELNSLFEGIPAR